MNRKVRKALKGEKELKKELDKLGKIEVHQIIWWDTLDSVGSPPKVVDRLRKTSISTVMEVYQYPQVLEVTVGDVTAIVVKK